MNKIPIWFINDWFDKHGGDVFRCQQAVRYQEDVNSKPKWTFPYVFIARIDNWFYVANEVDIYNNGLGAFYSEIGMTDKKPNIVHNYIRVYPSNRTEEYAIFASFYDNEEGWTHKQNMPWFSEDKFNRTKFLADIYKCLKRE